MGEEDSQHVGRRIRRARLAQRMTQEEVADKLGISSSTVSKYERTEADLDSSDILDIADALGTRAEVLLRPGFIEVQKPEFRKLKRLPKREEDAILAEVGEWIERYLQLEDLVDSSPPFRLDSTIVSSLDDVESVAENVRQDWGLGIDPIDNLTEVLEDRGVRVCPVEADGDFDAVTFRAKQAIPVIAVQKGVPGDRQRFSMAHELGHLAVDGEGVDAEAAANRFAGAFLVPREKVIAELGDQRESLNPHELHLLKHKYGLSMQSWVYRAKDVGVLSEAGATRMWKLFSRNGWREREPGEVFEPEEPTRMKRLLLRALQEEVIAPSRAAELVGMSLSEFQDDEARRHAGFPTSLRG